MRIPLILFTLGLLSFNAWAVEPPSTVPFAKRYDPASITTASRAREVIAAYDNEKRVWENWYKEETAQCYRNFFVTYCLDKAKSERTEHINEARRVWLVARDFLRKERSEQAVKDRKAAEAKQAAKNAKMDAQPARVAKAPSKTRDVTPRKPGEGHAADRVLTPEEEKANAEAYAMKQQEREQRIAEQESKVPEAPSMTPEERIQARAERRAAAKKKRAENIKKRAEKAAEYERQVKLREEQEKKNSVTGDLIPRL